MTPPQTTRGEGLLAWLANWLDRRRRSRDWRIAERFRSEVIWDDQGGRSGGFSVVVGEINGLGQRRIRIVSKPEWPADVKTSNAYAAAILWLTEPQPIGPTKLRAVK